MKHLFLACAITGLLAVDSISWAAANLNLSKSNINRSGAQFVAATVSLSGPNETQSVYLTPRTGDFVLTQLCVSPVLGGIRLTASGFGPIAHTDSALCYTFTPGVAVPKGSEISCSTTAAAAARGDYFCTLLGMLTQ